MHMSIDVREWKGSPLQRNIRSVVNCNCILSPLEKGVGGAELIKGASNQEEPFQFKLFS